MPDGALTGATREIQAGLGSFLQACHEYGVKVGPWRLQHVVPEYTFGEHPTYGVISISHWACKDGQPWKVGIGLFLAKSAGKPKDLEIKLSSMDAEPPVIDHLILMRPEDDLALTGKSKTVWQEAEKNGKHARQDCLAGSREKRQTRPAGTNDARSDRDALQFPALAVGHEGSPARGATAAESG
jgi:hypothetical protein